MKNAGKARSYGLYRHLRTSKEIIENLLNYLYNIICFIAVFGYCVYMRPDSCIGTEQYPFTIGTERETEAARTGSCCSDVFVK